MGWTADFKEQVAENHDDKFQRWHRVWRAFSISYCTYQVGWFSRFLIYIFLKWSKGLAAHSALSSTVLWIAAEMGWHKEWFACNCCGRIGVTNTSGSCSLTRSGHKTLSSLRLVSRWFWSLKGIHLQRKVELDLELVLERYWRCWSTEPQLGWNSCLQD